MAETSPSVLVIRLDAIGDALALTPLLAALGERGIPVDLVLRESNAGVFSPRAARSVFVAPFALRSSSKVNLHVITAFGRELRRRAYTHVLVATEDPSGYRLAGAVGAPSRIGFANGWGKPFKTLWVRAHLNRVMVRTAGLDPKMPHECGVLWKLGRELIGPGEPTRDPAHLAPLILERDLSRTSQTLFQVTDKWERLGIPFESVCRSWQLLSAHSDLHAIAPASEEAYTRRMADALGIHIEVLNALDPWKEAIASARAVVAPDSGAIHLAGMLGTPVVAVFPDSPYFAEQTSRWAPWAAPYRIIRASDPEIWPKLATAGLRELTASY
jgi:ADP-heptose:LPS heptosyltransferase